eukprot:4671278-Pyramimonas_sp.AAC.1
MTSSMSSASAWCERGAPVASSVLLCHSLQRPPLSAFPMLPTRARNVSIWMTCSLMSASSSH